MENQDSLKDKLSEGVYNFDNEEDIAETSRKSFKEKVIESLGNLRSIITFCGTIVLWVAAAIFFLMQKTVMIDNITPTTITLCNIMMGLSFALAIIMAALLVTSIVLYLNQNKTADKKDDKA